MSVVDGTYLFVLNDTLSISNALRTKVISLVYLSGDFFVLTVPSGKPSVALTVILLTPFLFIYAARAFFSALKPVSPKVNPAFV